MDRREEIRQALIVAREALDRADRDVAVAVTAARLHGLTEDYIAGALRLTTHTLRARYGRRIAAKRVLPLASSDDLLRAREVPAAVRAPEVAPASAVLIDLPALDPSPAAAAQVSGRA